jgi:hypothetical protein
MILTFNEKEFNNEQSFKMAYLKLKPKDLTCLCIETEETIKGFPDVMIVDGWNTVSFEEYKYTKTGVIKFQSTQPAFYKKHKKFVIFVVAYNAKSKKVHYFPVEELFTEGSPYKLSNLATVDLNKAEDMYNERTNV